MLIRFMRTNGDPSWPVPARGSPGASGLDLASAADATLEPGERRNLPSGWAVEIPPGFEGQVRSRSGTALKRGLVILTGVGTIDSDYRGDIGLTMLNVSAERQTVRRGERIAQLVVARVEDVEPVTREEEYKFSGAWPMAKLIERYFLDRDIPVMIVQGYRDYKLRDGMFLSWTVSLSLTLDHEDWKKPGLAFRERLAAAEPCGETSRTGMDLYSSYTDGLEGMGMVEIFWKFEKDGRFFWPDNNKIKLTAAEAESIFGESGETAA